MSSGPTNAPLLTYCTQCGKSLQLGARFCTACGAAVVAGKPQTTTPSNGIANDLFIEALKLTLAKDSAIPAMPLLQKALASGFAPDDEVEARLSLSQGYREIVGNSGLPWQKMVETNEFRQCIIEIEKAFELDQAGSLGFFSQPLNIGRLKHADLMYK